MQRKLILEDALESTSLQNDQYQQEIQKLKLKLEEYEKTRYTQSSDTKTSQDKVLLQFCHLFLFSL
jgi:hypothetical protein